MPLNFVAVVAGDTVAAAINKQRVASMIRFLSHLVCERAKTKQRQCTDGYALNRLDLRRPCRVAARLRARSARLGKLALFNKRRLLLGNTHD